MSGLIKKRLNNFAARELWRPRSFTREKPNSNTGRRAGFPRPPLLPRPKPLPPPGKPYLHRTAIFFSNFWPQTALLLLLTLILTTLNAMEPLVMKYIVDSLTDLSGTAGTVLAGILLLAALLLGREVISWVSNWFFWRTRIAVQLQLLGAMASKLHRQHLDFYKGEGVGAIMTRFDRYLQGVVDAASQIMLNAIPPLLYLCITLVVMIRLDWRLAILVCLFTPVSPLLSSRSAPVQTARERTLLETWTRIYSRFNEVLASIVVVKSFAKEEEEKERFIDSVKEANRTVMRSVVLDSHVQFAQSLAVSVARLSAIALGAYLISRREISIGTLIAFLSYIGAIFGPVQSLSNVYRKLKTASVSLEGVFRLLDSSDGVKDAPTATDLKVSEGRIEFKDVRFGYRENGAPILRDLSLRIEPGETHAVVGPSGAGKSTLLALVERFYDPEAGSITIDGQDLRSVKQMSLRRQIGVVLQEAMLFNDTISNNIAYGKPEASAAQIERAARAAHCHDFIAALPEGYQTKIGERGGFLSGGQRQRLAIARALLVDAPILVLDEATSALDAETEHLIQSGLDELMRGKTTLVIAHRLSTVMKADRIHVLINGLIVESGTHQQLINTNGYYAYLVRQQTSGLLPDEPLERRRGRSDRRRAAPDRRKSPGDRRRPVVRQGEVEPSRQL